MPQQPPVPLTARIRNARSAAHHTPGTVPRSPAGHSRMPRIGCSTTAIRFCATAIASEPPRSPAGSPITQRSIRRPLNGPAALPVARPICSALRPDDSFRQPAHWHARCQQGPECAHGSLAMPSRPLAPPTWLCLEGGCVPGGPPGLLQDCDRSRSPRTRSSGTPVARSPRAT